MAKAKFENQEDGKIFVLTRETKPLAKARFKNPEDGTVVELERETKLLKIVSICMGEYRKGNYPARFEFADRQGNRYVYDSVINAEMFHSSFSKAFLCTVGKYYHQISGYFLHTYSGNNYIYHPRVKF